MAPAVVPLPEPPAAVPDYDDGPEFTSLTDTTERNGSHSTESSVSLLPRRRPGSSGITGVPAARRSGRSIASHRPSRTRSPSNRLRKSLRRSRFRTPRRSSARGCGSTGRTGSVPKPNRSRRSRRLQADLPEVDDVWTAEAAPPANQAPEDDLIYQRMLSEWLVDPRELAHSPDLDWQSVWDSGWSAAAEVESVPVQAHTDQGLPVREPGARLVPGGAGSDQNGNAHHRASEDNGIASNGGFESGRPPAHEAPVRDPDAVRASISSHFGGVRAGRSHARDTDQGTDHE